MCCSKIEEFLTLPSKKFLTTKIISKLCWSIWFIQIRKNNPPACLSKCIPHFNGKWAGPPAESVIKSPTTGRQASPKGVGISVQDFPFSNFPFSYYSTQWISLYTCMDPSLVWILRYAPLAQDDKKILLQRSAGTLNFQFSIFNFPFSIFHFQLFIFNFPFSTFHSQLSIFHL